MKSISSYALDKRNAKVMATRSIIRDYGVSFSAQRANLTNRTSYVIAPNGRIIYSYSDLNWQNHVTNTLHAVQEWRARQRRGRR